MCCHTAEFEPDAVVVHAVVHDWFITDCLDIFVTRPQVVSRRKAGDFVSLIGDFPQNYLIIPEQYVFISLTNAMLHDSSPMIDLYGMKAAVLLGKKVNNPVRTQQSIFMAAIPDRLALQYWKKPSER